MVISLKKIIFKRFQCGIIFVQLFLVLDTKCNYRSLRMLCKSHKKVIKHGFENNFSKIKTSFGVILINYDKIEFFENFSWIKIDQNFLFS